MQSIETKSDFIRWRNYNEKTLKKRINLFMNFLNDEDRVMDFGCGIGSMIGLISKKTVLDKNSVGYDIDKRVIDIAKECFPDIKFKIFNGKRIPEKANSFDAIICSEVIEHISEPIPVINEFQRVLKPHGKLMLTTPYHSFLKDLLIIFFNREKHFHNYKSDHLRFYTKNKIMALLEENGFRVIRFEGIGRILWLWRSMFICAVKNSH